jgi:hypothetical protein
LLCLVNLDTGISLATTIIFHNLSLLDQPIQLLN